MTPEERRNVIIEYYKNPINKKVNEDQSYISENSSIASCIDDITIAVKFEKDKFKDITFDGDACAVSMSSSSVMIKNLIGKTVEEAKIFMDNFEKMLYDQPYDKKILNDAYAYVDISKQKSRIKCALLPYEALKVIIDKRNEKTQ